ncbi:MAG: hypothetical protein AAB492_03565 [Patescibacteria group bacterium]
MPLLFSLGLHQSLSGKYSYVDNDFLSELYNNTNVLTEFATFIQSNSVQLLIDPFIEFEFLRDIFLPIQVDNRRKFLSKDFFTMAPMHQEQFKIIQVNAMVLSRIYKHKSNNNKSSSSLVDLLLAGRLSYQGYPLLITGNKKDFPSCIFDTLGVINIEHEGDGEMRVFSIIKFNKDKFEVCSRALDSLNKMVD